jgi:subtilisin
VPVDVAVVDTGIGRHADLNVVGGKNCSNGPASDYRRADNGHGTHVAGTLAAKDNSFGVVGVAPGARLWSVRVLRENGSGKWSHVLCGLDFVDARAPANGGPIRVANLSLGSRGSDTANCGTIETGDGATIVIDPLHEAFCRLRQHGVTVVVSAGNNYHRVVRRYKPAAYDQVITATALADYDGRPSSTGRDFCPPEPAPFPGSGTVSYGYGPDDDFASFSNYSDSRDSGHTIGAPGTCIVSTLPGGRYGDMDGTSMAAPHIAGAAALFAATRPGARFEHILPVLQFVGEPPGPGHRNAPGNDLHPERVLRVADL